MHSCTAQLLGQPLRPWNISLSTYDSDELIEALAAQLQNEGMHVGLHEPFNIKRDSQQNSLAVHAWKRKLPQIHIEIRQGMMKGLLSELKGWLGFFLLLKSWQSRVK